MCLLGLAKAFDTVLHSRVFFFNFYTDEHLGVWIPVVLVQKLSYRQTTVCGYHWSFFHHC